MVKSINKMAGFSLVELSMVVLVISLIIAGLTAGSKLVAYAELKSIVTQMNQYKAATETFKVTYDYLPGDHPGASALFDVQSWNIGNGNGIIDQNAGAEEFTFWQQLAHADLIPGKGSFTGWYYLNPGELPGDSTPSNGAKIGENVPGSTARGDIGFGVRFGTIGSGIYEKPSTDDRFFILAGGYRYGYDFQNAGLSGQEMYIIDKKFDDGLSNRGNINATGGVSSFPSDCEDGSGNYNLSFKHKSCVMIFYMD